MILRRASLLFALLLPLIASGKETLSLAVASNFHVTAREIASRFERSSGIDVRLSSGSTGKLFAQIVNGAPYDVFLAADTERPKRLLADGLAVKDSLIVYATGFLALWSADSSLDDGDCLAALRRQDYNYLAVANPDIAPYGAASRDFLQAEGLWEAAADKLVLGGSIAQTYQFVATGNARLGLVAASQLKIGDGERPACVEYPLAIATSPLEIPQAGVVLTRTKVAAAAARFMSFMQSSEVRALIRDDGYDVNAVAHDGEP